MDSFKILVDVDSAMNLVIISAIAFNFFQRYRDAEDSLTNSQSYFHFSFFQNLKISGRSDLNTGQSYFYIDGRSQIL